MHYIFVHGLGQNSSAWDKTISGLAKQEHILCPDLSSFLKKGESTYTKLYQSFAEYCDNVPEPVNICGLSLGGVLALNYAVWHPERVKSLVLIAAQYEMPRVLLKLQNIIFKLMPDSSFQDTGLGKQDFMKLTGSMADLNFSADLKNISCPVLVLCGEKDGANKKAAKGLAERIAGAEIHFMENSGHEVNIDVPQELAECINDFFDRYGL